MYLICRFKQSFYFYFFTFFFWGLQSGLPCVWMDARDVLVVTPTGKQQVDPEYEASDKRLDEWYSRFPSDTIIVTGFIASTPDGIPTTLKRDGSDLSAAIMGALLQASKVTIWTDVDGVYSADPRKGNVLSIRMQ
jgi:aspartokinase/homoserine dehydrogenase 1